VTRSLGKAPAQPNKSLIDGIDLLLQVVASGDDGVGVRDLARRIGSETTRVQRLLATLAHLGLARQGSDRRYRPGPGIHVLSAMSLSASGLIGRAMPQLQALREGERTAALGVLWRDEVCYLYHASGAMSAAEALGRLQHYPAPRSSIGMVLLAAQDPDYLRRHLGAELAAEIDPELARIRTRGYACLETAAGVRSVAVAIGQPAYAGLAVSGPLAGRAVPELVDRLREAVAAIGE